MPKEEEKGRRGAEGWFEKLMGGKDQRRDRTFLAEEDIDELKDCSVTLGRWSSKSKS